MAKHPPLATLIVSCPDRKGLVAGLAQFLTEHGANIVHAEQHRDDISGLFFQRMQFETGELSSAEDELQRDLAEWSRGTELNWRLSYNDTLARVAVFVSRVEHCLYDLLLRQRSGDLPGEIALVVSNHVGLAPVAEHFEIPFRHIEVTPQARAAAEERQMALLREFKIDLIVLARYMQILSPDFVAAYPSRIINIHHSFLPAFAGGRPYHQAHEHGVKLIGATSHYVTSTLDEGPIIDQDVVRVSHRDSLDDLIARGRDVEKLVLARAVKAHLEHRVVVCGSKTIVFSK